MSEYNYKDPVRVECLKHDWEELCPTDQATLLVEWGVKTVEDFKTDWKAKLLSWGKWLLIAIAGAISLLGGALLMSSCTFNQRQIDMDGMTSETSLQVNPVGDSLSGLISILK